MTLWGTYKRALALLAPERGLVAGLVVSNVVIDKVAKNGDVTARSRFHMMELRRDDVRHFAGQYTHHLKKAKGGYRIKLQRVDMVNAQAAYDYVLQVWV